MWVPAPTCDRFINWLNEKLLLPKKTLNSSWTPQHDQRPKGINMAGLCKHCSNLYFYKFLVLESSIKITKIKPRDVRQFSRATVTKTCILQIVAIAWKNRYFSPMLKNYWMKNRITEWLNETIWIMSDSTLSGYQIVI